MLLLLLLDGVILVDQDRETLRHLILVVVAVVLMLLDQMELVVVLVVQVVMGMDLVEMEQDIQ